MAANEAQDAGYLTWGASTAKLLRTMRLEAARSGHADAMPAHLLLAVLDQPEVHQALRAIRQAPNVYTIRARVAEASLGPAAYDDALPLSRLTETVLSGVRARGKTDEDGMLFLLVLRETLSNQACRTLIERGGADPDALAGVLGRIA